MGNKLRKFLTAFVTALGLVILICSSQSTSTKAATNYTTNDLLSGMSIAQKNYGTGSNIDLTLDWNTENLANDLQNGDTWTVQLPEILKVTKPGTTIPLTDKDTGEVLGTAVLNADNTITVTFTNVDGKTDHKGQLQIGDGIGVGKGYIIGDNDVQIGDFNDNMTIVNPELDFSKKGVLGEDENGDAIITWSVLLNRNSVNMSNLVANETINPDQTFIPGSINVYTARWSNSQPGIYYKQDPVTGYTVTPNEEDITNQFSITNFPKENQFYVVTFQTRINDQDNVNSNSSYKNNATFNWGNGGSGNNSTVNDDKASASVRPGSNSGNGSGNNITGSVVLTKRNTGDENTLIPGATYNLYKAGSTTPINDQPLVTDANGQISVPNLQAGDYYFKETEPAPGYKLNELEVPFQITTKNRVAEVTTADDPETKLDTGALEVMKLDAETGYRLEGAEFAIYDEAGNLIHTITTDKNGIANLYDLPAGKYSMKEVKTPSDAYLTSDKVYDFEITNDKLAIMIPVDNYKSEVLDDSFFVELQKFDSSNMEKVVPNAEYTLYAADGTEIETNLTDDKGMISIEGLKPGKYYFKETKAPNGYELNKDPIEFTITNDNAAVNYIKTSDDPITEGGGNEGNTSEPGDNNGNEGNTSEPGDNNGNEGNTSEPGDNNGNEGNTSEPGDNNGNEGSTSEPDDNNSGVIIDPENPGSNNNNGNSTDGLITAPSNTNNNASTANNNNNSASTLPQTGEKSGLIASLLGLVLLVSGLYFKRHNA